MTIVAVDIDDTLYSFGNLAREIFVDMAIEDGDKRYQRGAYCAWSEWRTPADVADDGFWMKVINRCHQPENILAQTPFTSAADILTELAEDYELHYISTRDPSAMEATAEWLEMHRFPDGQLSCNWNDKLPQIRDCQFLIDDRPKTLVQFVYDYHWKHLRGPGSYLRKGFGLHLPYNAALTDVPGIKLAPNWKLLRHYLIDQKVLTPRSTVGTHS